MSKFVSTDGACVLSRWTTRRLASLAVRALIEEAELTPKPALADDRGGGAQEGLSVSLMRRSAHLPGAVFRVERVDFA